MPLMGRWSADGRGRWGWPSWRRLYYSAIYGLATGSSPPRLLGRSPQIGVIGQAIPRLARLDTPVLGGDLRLRARCLFRRQGCPSRLAGADRGWDAVSEEFRT